jgi:trimethylamine:corrinoid methyltransferase-like protein
MSNLIISYFNLDQQRQLKSMVFELLSQRGVRMDHPEVLTRLDDAGARVDMGTRIVRFPEAFLEEQVAKAPREFALYGRGGREPLHLPPEKGAFITRTNTGAHSWIEPDSGIHRRVTLADVADWGELADALENIDFCGFPGPGDVPAETVDLHSFKTLLQNTNKHIWVQPYTVENVDDLIRLSVIAAGDEGTLKSNPPVSFIVCAFSPLIYKALDMDIITKSAAMGIPLQLCSAPVAGATAPITPQGVALMAVAEILAMVVTSQVIQPGIPVIATPLIFTMDMRSGRSLQATPEALRGCALAAQFIKAEFGLPTHSYGAGTDALSVDGQARHESAIICMTMALSGIDILGGAGQLETATTISPLQLIADNELFGQTRALMSEMSLDDETLAWEDLLAIEPGANFLRSPHTRRQAREVGQSILFTHLGRDSWKREGSEGLLNRAEGIYRRIIGEETPPLLTEDQVTEMDSIIKSAESKALR